MKSSFFYDPKKKKLDLEDAAEGSLAEIFDVDDVVARVLEFLQTRVDLSADAVIGRVVPQLFQVDVDRALLRRAKRVPRIKGTS